MYCVYFRGRIVHKAVKLNILYTAIGTNKEGMHCLIYKIKIELSSDDFFDLLK